MKETSGQAEGLAPAKAERRGGRSLGNPQAAVQLRRSPPGGWSSGATLSEGSCIGQRDLASVRGVLHRPEETAERRHQREHPAERPDVDGGWVTVFLRDAAAEGGWASMFAAASSSLKVLS